MYIFIKKKKKKKKIERDNASEINAQRKFYNAMGKLSAA